MPTPYPQNVGGDFYVEDGCCATCDVPRIEAPDLFTYADDPAGYVHCYVSRQPENESELTDMLRVIRCAELQCIHYRGSDPALLKRLVDMGESDICDAIETEPDYPTQFARPSNEVQLQDRPHVSTLSLFGYLLTVLSVELEVGVILLHVFTQKRLEPFAHFSLLGISFALTTFTYVRGKRDFALLRATGGRIPLTASQGVLVTMFMVSFGVALTFIAIHLFDL